MSPLDASKFFREKADAYLDMTRFANDERERRLLHELFEENEAKSELQYGTRIVYLRLLGSSSDSAEAQRNRLE